MNPTYEINKKGLLELKEELIARYSRVIRVKYRASTIPEESDTLKNIRWAMVSKRGNHYYIIEADRTITPELCSTIDGLLQKRPIFLDELYSEGLVSKSPLIDWVMIENYKCLQEEVAGGDYRKLEAFRNAAGDVAGMLSESKGKTAEYIEKIKECVIPLGKRQGEI